MLVDAQPAGGYTFSYDPATKTLRAYQAGAEVAGGTNLSGIQTTFVAKIRLRHPAR